MPDRFSPDQWIEDYLNGEEDAAHKERFEHWLLESPANIRYFADAINRDVQLRSAIAGSQLKSGFSVLADGDADDQLKEIDREIMSDLVVQAMVKRKKQEVEDAAKAMLAKDQAELHRQAQLPDRQSDESERSTLRVIIIPKAIAWMSIAAVLALVGILIYQLNEQPSESVEAPIAQAPDERAASPDIDPPDLVVDPAARLIRSYNAQWNELIIEGDRLEPGLAMTLINGFAQIEMERGASVLLQGPCTFELIDDNRIKLDEGQFTAVVPEQAKHFTVQTASMTIEDLGTRFGVRVLPDGSASTSVFQGEVLAHENDRGFDTPARRIALTAGQQLSADPISGLAEDYSPIQLDHGFLTDWQAVIGQVAIEGQARLLQTPPTGVDQGGYHTAKQLIVFQEATAVTDRRIDAWAALLMKEKPVPVSLAPGHKATSYFVHYSPGINGSGAAEATLTFPGRILGVIGDQDELIQTNSVFGLDSVRYVQAIDDDYNYTIDPGTTDYFEIIGEEQNTLRINLSAGVHADQVRVLVAVPEMPL